MIIDRYLLRELTVTFLGVALVLVLIILSATFVRILAEAAEGAYPQQIVFMLFLLKSVPNLAVVMPLAFFLAVMLALGRLYKDSEMVVLAACGVSPNRPLRAVAVLAVVVGLMVAVLTLYLVPYTQEQSHKLLDAAASSAEIDGIVAGRFNVSADGKQLIYAEAISSDRRELINVFAQGASEGVPVVVSASHANQVIDPESGDRYLVLHNGFRYDGKPGSPGFRIVQFERHGVRIQERAVEPSKRALFAMSTDELLRSGKPRDRAEVEWRMSAPVATVLLGLLAVPLARTNPRQGRYGRLFTGLMVYIVYNNVLTVARSWVGKEEVPAWIGMWWAHALMLALVLFFVWRQGKLSGPRRVPFDLRRRAVT